MNIAAWLRSLGLEQYDRAFRDNGIDGEVLPELTDEHLKELGLPLGPRLKVLKAIAAFRAASPAAGNGEPAAASAEVSEGARPGAGVPEAERRQLTVMFVDLVGSTVLSGRLDPEDMRAAIRTYQDACAGVIARFDGHIAKYMGDGVLAYFGYPKAHEDDAERAVRAGLGVAEAVGRLTAPDGTPLAARVGIATGLVVVGELIGDGAAREQTVIGETPNLAARLQDLGEPGGVVVGRRTRQLLGGLFELADLGAHRVKGFARPVQAWRVVGEGAAESRFEALHTTGLTPLVGREHELGLLLERWQLAKDGEGQVVLLSGEPGIGKSRLVRALRERLGDEPYTGLSHYCSPYHQASALHPVIGLIERAAGFARDDSPERKLDKLEATLALATDRVREVAPLLAALLAIPAGGERYPPLDLTPQRQKEKTLAALLDQLAGLAARQPVLAVYEDVHWSDPTTLELLERIIDRVEALPVLVLITFRPEFTPPWGGHAHVTALTLNRLGRRHGRTLVERVTGGKALPVEIAEQIVAKTDGVPLFVEELTKAVLESGLLREEADRYALAGPLPPLAIPATLHDSLMARLDRLTPVKEVAQIGAAIGRGFSHELLAAVAPLGDNEIKDALDQLVQAGLIFRRGVPPEASYSFKHALVRDAAYQSLLKSKRQQLHARIAQVLEERFPDTAETAPELLAQHYTEAGLIEKAVGYWHQAGRQAMARSAMAEAIAQLRQGSALLAGLPDGPARRRQELDLQTALGGALSAAAGWAAAETGKALARARELCRPMPMGETPQLFPVLVGQWSFHLNRVELGAAREVGEELLRLAQQQGDVAAQVMGHRVVGTSLLHLGELASARAHLEQAIALHDPVRHRSLAFGYAHLDPRVAGLSWLSWVLFLMGCPEQARLRSSEALTHARELSHVTTTGFGLHLVGSLCQFRGDRDAVLERAEELILLATEQSQPMTLALGTVLQGWALAAGGDAEEGSRELRRGIVAYQATGAQLWLPYFLALLAEAVGHTGQPVERLNLLAEALARVERTSERWFEAELHRLKGELLLSPPEPNPDEAEGCFHRAVAVAREQGARLWELRAATSLARLSRDQGRRSQAYDLLAPIYGWFTEGFDTPDLKDAKALLDELS